MTEMTLYTQEGKAVQAVSGWQVKHDLNKAMRERCEAQGHEYENCCDMFLGVYQECRWCGDQR